MMEAATRREGAGAALGALPAAIAGRWEVTGRIATRGAEADLFMVRDGEGNERVAKVYRYGVEPRSEVIERIEGLDTTCVVRIDAHGTHDGIAWEILEHVQGGTLREDNEREALSEVETRELIEQLAEGLEAMHAIGIEHRDLKPENILVRTRSPLDVAIADFGIASVLESTVHLTAAAWTMRYAPPEAVMGTGDGQSAITRTKWDYWALGMIMTECLTGTHPFAETAPGMVAYRLATEDTARLADALPEGRWRELGKGLLARDPNVRWAGREVREWLGPKRRPVLRANPVVDFVRHGISRTAYEAIEAMSATSAHAIWCWHESGMLRSSKLAREQGVAMRWGSVVGEYQRRWGVRIVDVLNLDSEVLGTEMAREAVGRELPMIIVRRWGVLVNAAGQSRRTPIDRQGRRWMLAALANAPQGRRYLRTLVERDQGRDANELSDALAEGNWRVGGDDGEPKKGMVRGRWGLAWTSNPLYRDITEGMSEREQAWCTDTIHRSTMDMLTDAGHDANAEEEMKKATMGRIDETADAIGTLGRSERARSELRRAFEVMLGNERLLADRATVAIWRQIRGNRLYPEQAWKEARRCA